MQNGDAELAVLVDVGVVEGVGELEFRGGVGVVFGEFHAGEEVAAIVEGVGVNDDEGDGPVEDVVLVELQEEKHKVSLTGVRKSRYGWGEIWTVQDRKCKCLPRR